VVLAVVTVRLRETRTQKALFILTGVSAAGILLLKARSTPDETEPQQGAPPEADEPRQ